jgi:hypothetical protein
MVVVICQDEVVYEGGSNEALAFIEEYIDGSEEGRPPLVIYPAGETEVDPSGSDTN